MTATGPAIPRGAHDSPQVVAGTMGLYLFLASLTMLFAASIVGYLVIRSTHQPWPPPGFPALPRSLWLSTLAIVCTSGAVQIALGGARRGDSLALRGGLLLTLLLGVTFLGLQTYAWVKIYQQVHPIAEQLGTYVKLFYVLTGLHAAHVIGGLIPLCVVTRRAFADRYRPSFHPGVRYCATYWHFLDAVWCVLFVVLFLV